MPKRRMYSPLEPRSFVFVLQKGLIDLLLALVRQFELVISQVDAMCSLPNRSLPKRSLSYSHSTNQNCLNYDGSAGLVHRISSNHVKRHASTGCYFRITDMLEV